MARVHVDDLTQLTILNLVTIMLWLKGKPVHHAMYNDSMDPTHRLAYCAPEYLSRLNLHQFVRRYQICNSGSFG